METSADINPMAELVGPFYTLDGLARVLHTGVEALERMQAEGDLLVVRTDDGVEVAPSYQVNKHSGTKVGNFSTVNRLFAEAEVDPWTTAVWFVTTDESLDDKTPVEWLKSGRNINQLKEYAGRSIRRYIG
jgi:hypothetical protein